ncbi:MAG: permease [Hyphomonas sp. BRH_c22]|uniref:LPS export ABC transporter permease LptG n=1 Tax=Hyphomonas sp. BRH_c22 TaxID=1629710 RepID=UPI0005F124E2|nr:LPS export ABC transporter permease LptG [Hyphomonas sp. BRH_c22]KJS36342.1 MAG: permease [Hyphomonas sp. BRH_c22]
MTFTFSRIQRYILRECLTGLALVLGVLLLAILMIDVVEQLRTVGGDVKLSLAGALRLSLMKLPQIVEQTLPFAILVASMLAFTRLNRRSELSIIRASGISAWRFLAPVIVMALVLGILTTTVLNPFAARLTETFELERARLLNEGRQTMTVSDTGVWLRQGDDTSQIVIHAKRVEDGGIVLIDVKLIEEERLFAGSQPTNDYVFVRRIDADRAYLRNGFWQLENVVENVPNLPPERKPNLAIPTSLDAVTLLDKFASPNTIGFWNLPRFVSQTRAAGLDASRYTMRWNTLMATPALFVAMGLIGAIVCLRLSRLGGTSQLLAIGSLLAVGLYFFTQFSSSLGATGAAPPVVAAWSPPLFVLFGTLTWLAYREDG